MGCFKNSHFDDKKHTLIAIFYSKLVFTVMKIIDFWALTLTIILQNDFQKFVIGAFL